MASVPTVKRYARERLTISAPRVAFLSWSMSGPIGFLPVMIVTKLNGGHGLLKATLIHVHNPNSIHPEHYFEFDPLTAEMLPQKGLNKCRRSRAQNTISDLRLNGRHHLKKRLAWLLLLSEGLKNDANAETSDMKNLRRYLVSRRTHLSSIARAWLSQRGYAKSNEGPLRKS